MTWRATTVAFDDQVAAVIRDLGQGTTGDVVSGLGNTPRVVQSQTTCTCRCGHVHKAEAQYRRYRVTSDQVRPALRRLAEHGLAIEIPPSPPNNHGGHGWLWIGDTT